MKIMFIIPAMNIGGAENALYRLAQYFDENHQVTLGAISSKPPHGSFNMKPSIKQIYLDLMGAKGWRKISQVISRHLAVRKIVRRENPNVVISFINTMNIIVLVSLLGLKKPVIISERTDPSEHNLPLFTRFLYNITYPLADNLVVQTNKIKSYYPPDRKSVV